MKVANREAYAWRRVHRGHVRVLKSVSASLLLALVLVLLQPAPPAYWLPPGDNTEQTLGSLAFASAPDEDPRPVAAAQAPVKNLLVYRALLVITTESDWTDVLLHGSGEILSARVSVVEGANAPELRYWYQSSPAPPFIHIGKKQYDTTRVVLEAKVILDITGSAPVVLGIRKGALGYTRVDVYQFNTDEPMLVGTYTRLDSGVDVQTFDLRPSDLTSNGPIMVGPDRTGPTQVWASYYTWYTGYPYDSGDEKVIERQIRQAKSAGIDGFIVSWWGPGGLTDINFRKVLQTAKREQFGITMYLESLFGATPRPRPVAELTDMLSYFLTSYGKDEGLYREEGAPLIFVWAAGSHTPQEWAQIFAAAASRTGLKAKYSAQATEIEYLEVFDGLHAYGTGGIVNLTDHYRRGAIATLTYHLLADSDARKMWVPAAMPGFLAAGTSIPREGGAYFQRTFEAAMNAIPDWIHITSWNEYPENTYIEPDSIYQYTYLDLTGVLVSQLKEIKLLPKVQISQTPTRQPNYIGEPLDVQAQLENVGNGSAIGIRLEEAVSETFESGGGQVSEVDRLLPGESVNLPLSYVPTTTGALPLPEARVSFTDLYNQRYSLSSELVLVDVRDKIRIDSILPPATRVDVGSTQHVLVHAAWLHAGSDVAGARLYVGDILGVTNSMGWATLSIRSLQIGRQSLQVTQVLLNSSDWKYVIPSAVPSITWDRVVITLSVPPGRVEAGSDAPISWVGRYEFDGSPFAGVVTFNDTVVTRALGKYSLVVASISDPRYGLSVFSSNVVEVAFDRIRLGYRSESWTPGRVIIYVMPTFESDGSDVAHAIVTVNGVTAARLASGEHSVELLTFYPSQSVTLGITLAGFTPVVQTHFAVAFGNLLLFVALAVVAALGAHRLLRRKARRSATLTFAKSAR